jgi:hypothetical protein
MQAFTASEESLRQEATPFLRLNSASAYEAAVISIAIYLKSKKWSRAAIPDTYFSLAAE